MGPAIFPVTDDPHRWFLFSHNRYFFFWICVHRSITTIHRLYPARLIKPIWFSGIYLHNPYKFLSLVLVGFNFLLTAQHADRMIFCYSLFLTDVTSKSRICWFIYQLFFCLLKQLYCLQKKVTAFPFFIVSFSSFILIYIDLALVIKIRRLIAGRTDCFYIFS